MRATTRTLAVEAAVVSDVEDAALAGPLKTGEEKLDTNSIQQPWLGFSLWIYMREPTLCSSPKPSPPVDLQTASGRNPPRLPTTLGARCRSGLRDAASRSSKGMSGPILDDPGRTWNIATAKHIPKKRLKGSQHLFQINARLRKIWRKHVELEDFGGFLDVFQLPSPS